ncbi:PorT family protein [Flavobacterium sp. LS1R49]|uniref:PorT family protein n=1 Tax=Flavobacterium shii TaxID=2987687 RepID=A0A9X2ZE70_9FLAO|nr:porin family protein [Flavobacterium shii]MCV9929731.1 PorT family protein [Flavobacterium shii]
MKKIIAVAALCMSVFSYGQVHLGAKAGVNLNKLDGKNFNSNFELGYQLGGFATVNFTDFLGVQGELLFNQTNTKVADNYRDVFNSAFKKGKTLNYISVPVLLRLNSEGLITVVAGPQFSFLASGNQSVLENGKKLFKKTDFAFIAGAEINIKPLTVYARYIWGFSDVSNFGGKANSQQIQAGLSLRLF